jgi:hypothetical protein
MGKRSPILIGVVTAAILLGVTAGTGSATQPAPPVKKVPPLSNACLKVGDAFQSAFAASGKPVSGTCLTTNPAGFSADDVERLTRGCRQAADNFGAADFFADPSTGGSAWTCSLVYAV